MFFGDLVLTLSKMLSDILKKTEVERYLKSLPSFPPLFFYPPVTHLIFTVSLLHPFLFLHISFIIEVEGKKEVIVDSVMENAASTTHRPFGLK